MASPWVIIKDYSIVTNGGEKKKFFFFFLQFWLYKKIIKTDKLRNQVLRTVRENSQYKAEKIYFNKMEINFQWLIGFKSISNSSRVILCQGVM